MRLEDYPTEPRYAATVLRSEPITEDGADVEVRELVRGSIDRLPETHRTVLMLRDIEELSTREAAELLGVSEGAVKVRLHRARLALREMLDAGMRRAES